MDLKHIDISKPLEAYDSILAAAKREGREPNTGDRMLAMRAAIEAYEDERKHVIPPTRGTGSQRDSDVVDLFRLTLGTLALHDWKEAEKIGAQYRAIEAEAECRGRAQGGNTNATKG